jgi:hypothetical protein
MQYAWYQILGFGLMFGVATFIVFRGLDLALESFLEWRRAKQVRRDLDETVHRFNAWKNRNRGA